MRWIGYGFSWASLDNGDDSLLGFGACIASASARFPQARGSEIDDLLRNRPAVQVEDLLASVVLSLERLQKRAVLVLDDFHVVHADDVCAFMDRLLSHPSHKKNLLVIGPIVFGFANIG